MTISIAVNKNLDMFSPTGPLESHVDLFVTACGKRLGTILADPQWQFQNRIGKVAPEHKQRLNRYGTMTLDDIRTLSMTR